MIYYLMHILVVQGTVSPPKKLLAQICLCINGRPAVITPNINITLRVPKVTKSIILAAGNSEWVLAAWGPTLTRKCYNAKVSEVSSFKGGMWYCTSSVAVY